LLLEEEVKVLIFVNEKNFELKSMDIKKAVPLHAMEALGGRGGVTPIHSGPRH
jgi:hypothetical protein